MSERKIRVTVTIDPHLAAYAEQLVAAGKADSVSAVLNSALSGLAAAAGPPRSPTSST